jgi:CubicO group peptidase (beta-lactamase class C family)
VPTLNDTKYDVASVTKVMATTLAIMNMASSNSIKLDDLVSKYIENYDTNKKGNTTIKNLLLHNAGLPYDYPGALPKNQSDVIDYIRFAKPAYPIGTQFHYSNLGFLLLSKIVEKITNKTFEAYTNQNKIFAGLKDSGFNPNKS